jgi:hypothetical protein
MSALTKFYRGEGVDRRGRTLADLWAFDDARMEGVHDFIQWMFPTREPSLYNPDAPLLTDSDVDEFRSDPRLRANLLRSFERFLAVLGLRYQDGAVVEAPDYDTKKVVFQGFNHNWLRITRVLASTRLLGLEGPGRAFFDFLKARRDAGASGVTADTFRYWEDAALRD